MQICPHHDSISSVCTTSHWPACFGACFPTSHRSQSDGRKACFVFLIENPLILYVPWACSLLASSSGPVLSPPGHPNSHRWQRGSASEPLRFCFLPPPSSAPGQPLLHCPIYTQMPPLQRALPVSKAAAPLHRCHSLPLLSKLTRSRLCHFIICLFLCTVFSKAVTLCCPLWS